MIEIIKPGTKARCGIVEGIISAAEISFNSVSYKFCYWLDNEYKCIWIHESEFTVIYGQEKQSIGFKQNGHV